MRKLVVSILIILYTFISCLYPLGAFADKEKTADNAEQKKYTPISEYTLLADLSSDFFMYGTNSSKSIEPSGFAKILTAITAIENTDDIYKEVTIEEGILEGYNFSNKNIGLKYGEEIRDFSKWKHFIETRLSPNCCM